MSSTPHHPSHRHAPSGLAALGALGALGVGLLLLGLHGEVTAQASAQWRSDRENAPLLRLAGRTTQEPAGLNYRVWVSHGGRADHGVDMGTRVGLEWMPAKSNFGLAQGALGLQLESGYRLSLKLRRGGPTVYLRGQF